MKVKMIKTADSAALDGINVQHYEKGKTYDLPPEAAENFIRKGWAAPVKKEKAVEPKETKVKGPEETKGK